MSEYTFDSQASSYFQGRDLRVTRQEDDRTIIVNRKEGFWGLDVKSEWIRSQRSAAVQTAADNLTDGLLSGIEQQEIDFFWRDAERLAATHGFSGTVFGEGRSGGWLCLDDTRTFESDTPIEPTGEEKETVARWLNFCFDADDLRITAEAYFDDLILAANQHLQVELAPYADWVGAEVQTLDGAIIKVARVEVRNGRPALMPEKPAKVFSFANEATLVRKADGEVPARLTADPIMEQVFQTVEARGSVTKDQLDAWLDASDDNDPSALYELHVAPAVDAIEDEITAHYSAPSQTSTD